MATAQSLIQSAREYASIGRQGETISGNLAESSRTTLNAMLDSWSMQRLYAYRIREETFTWASGNQSRTVGSGGNFDTDRPAFVDPATLFRKDNYDYPVNVTDKD